MVAMPARSGTQRNHHFTRFVFVRTSSCLLEPSDTALLTITEEVIKPNSVLCRIVIEKKRYKTI